MTTRGRSAWLLVAALTPALAFAACAASETHQGGGEGGIAFLPDGGGGFDPDAACALYEHQAITKPVNLYIMFDKSSSMAGTKWTAAKAGLTAFVEDDSASGLKIALRFFPRPADATPACDQAAYKTPDVDYVALPMGAAAIIAAIEAQTPDGFSTPIYPALGGALLESIDQAQQNPGEVSAVLLVTDGAPEGPAATCSGVDPEDPQVIADLAAVGLSAGVSTYVVGLPGVDQTSANLIAAAGGTDSAILVAASDVESQFQDALAKVRGDALPCAYDVPAEVQSGMVGLGLVNIAITPEGGEPQLVPFDPNCSGAGWHFDDASAPTAIVLCPATCASLKAMPGISIRVILGCNTLVK